MANASLLSFLAVIGSSDWLRRLKPYLSAGQQYMSQNTKPVYYLYGEVLGLCVSVAYAAQRTLKLAV